MEPQEAAAQPGPAGPGSQGGSQQHSADRGRPPLPPARGASMPGSLASSQVSSPRSLGQPSLQALSAMKLAQYRAGARTFKEDRAPRAGLSSGDMVAFHSPDGVYTVLPLEAEDPAAVHFGFAPSASHAEGEVATQLEVVRQGKWVAFRSTAAGDRFLQARKRSPRLVFFNTNIGTWEQWELAEEVEAGSEAPWARRAVVFKHRRLPQFELRVELVRVGTCSLAAPGAAITSRSLLPAAAGQLDGEVENVQLRKMSSVVMQEWFYFVDREKALRLNIAAQVAQLVEDAADLKAWTVSQVEGIRGEMDAEVTQLLATIQRKRAKLAETEARLTNRLRWGVAVLQAKAELRAKRLAFVGWRAMAARNKYCQHVVAKLQQRADLRLAARGLAAWAEWHQERQARQQRLWAAVRRMALVKMHQAFGGWWELVAAKREEAQRMQQLAAASWAHMQKWRLQQAFAAWRGRTASCAQGRALLARMASQAHQRMAAAAFSAWRQFVPQQRARVASLTALVAARRRHTALQQALAAWREAVDAKHGRRLQLARARHMLCRLRQRQALLAWRAWQLDRATRQAAWFELLRSVEQRQLRQAFTAWQEELAHRRERRQMLMQFVTERALSMTQHAFDFWRSYTAAKREHQYLLQQMVVRLSQRLLTTGWAAWRTAVAEAKVQRHRVAVCQRRRQASTMRAVLGAWRGWVARQRAQEMIVQLGHKRANRHRMAAALRALTANVEEAQAQRAQAAAAVQHCAAQLQRRALLGWVEAVQARRDFEQRLQGVQRGMQVQALRDALQGWRSMAQAASADRQRVAHARLLLGRVHLRAVFQAWRGYSSYQQHLQDKLGVLVQRRADQLAGAAFDGWRGAVAERRASVMRVWECTLRISQLRMGWAFQSWQQEAAERAAVRQRVQAAERRIGRVKAAAAFRAWREHTNSLATARAAAAQLGATRSAALVQHCLLAWADHTAARAEQHSAVVQFVLRRSEVRMANVLHFWRSYTDHMAMRRQQLQRACGKLRRVRLQQALAAWRRHAQERHATAAAQRAARQKLQAKRQARCFLAWRAHAAQLQQARQVAGELAIRTQRQAQLRLVAGALLGWRQQAQHARHVQRVGRNLAARRQQAMQAAAFQAWQRHTAHLRAVRSGINQQHQAEAGVVLRLALRGWRSHTAQRRAHRACVLQRCIERQAEVLQGTAFGAWRQYTQLCLRSEAVMMRAIERLSLRLMRGAFEAWRQAARARKARRTALARFMQRWQQQRLRDAFWQWRHALAEQREALDNLRRCLTRKRIAFKLFRNWYWESFDDEMQETLRTMFEITNEAAADPLPSRMGSPMGSLLSSPIRAQLGYAAGPRHQQLAAGVAQRLAGGSLQPSYLRFDQQAAQAEGQLPEAGTLTASLHLQLGEPAVLRQQPLPPQPAPLRSRVASAVSSPAKPAQGPVLAPVPIISGTFLSPLRGYADNSLAGQLHQRLLEEEEEWQPSPGSAAGRQMSPGAGAYPLRSPAHQQWSPLRESAASGGALSGSAVSGTHSKAASTIVPRSPLTPTSEGYGLGGTPMTHCATPNPADGLFSVQRVPGTILGSAQKQQRQQQQLESEASHAGSAAGDLLAQLPEAGAGAAAASPARSLSPVLELRSPGSLSDAPTPGAGFFGGGQGGTPASQARTPYPGAAARGAASPAAGWGGDATPDPDLAGEGWSTISPGLLQQLAEAATPVPAGMSPSSAPQFGAQAAAGRLAEEGSAAGPPSATVTQFHTPQTSFRALKSGLPKLQGDYSIWRLGAAQEALAAQGTPDPDAFISAYPATAGRAGLALTEEELSAAKTPLSYTNPIAFDSPRLLQ